MTTMTTSTPIAAPATALNLLDMQQGAINMLREVATTGGPVIAAGGPPTRGNSLDALVRRGMAVVDTTAKPRTFTISDRGVVLATLLWPGDAAVQPPKPATDAPAARTTRTPRVANGRTAAKPGAAARSPRKVKSDAAKPQQPAKDEVPAEQPETETNAKVLAGVTAAPPRAPRKTKAATAE